MLDKLKNKSHPVFLIMIFDTIILLLWRAFRHKIEPFLFGGYSIIELFLIGTLLACGLFVARSFWNRQSDPARYVWGGIVLLLFTCTYYAKLSTLNNLDTQSPFYPMLAEAFSIGQYHLIPLPSRELLSLSDPYAPENVNIPGRIGDAVLFDGKYYLYYGPIPAIVLIMADWLFQTKFDNAFLMTFFLSLFATMIFLIIYHIWRRKYSNVPWFVPLLCLATITWSFPVLWLVGRPSVYESAIIGGQAFLLTGLYLLLVNFDDKKTSSILLLGAGCSFGLSIGARLSLIAPVLFLSFFVFLLLIGSSLDIHMKVKLLASFFLPLVLLATIYGVYNYRRFGSPTEFGVKYALPGWGKIPEKPFSLGNVKNNLILYVFMPPADLSIKYPFITFAGVREQVSGMYNVYGVVPNPEYGEYGYGYFAYFCSVFWVAPLSIAGFFTIWGMIKGLIGGSIRSPSTLVDWFTKHSNHGLFFLCLSFLASLLILLAYMGTENRYHMDYFPSLSLLASIAFIKIFPLIKKSLYSELINSFLLLLTFYSVAMGVVAGLTGRHQYFLVAAPEFVKFLDYFLSLFLPKIF